MAMRRLIDPDGSQKLVNLSTHTHGHTHTRTHTPTHDNVYKFMDQIDVACHQSQVH